MISSEVVLILFVAIFLGYCLVHLGCCMCFHELCNRCPCRAKKAQQQTSRRTTNQTPDIWNISGRVNQEGPVTSEPHRWPTHDHHVSIDSFVLPSDHQSHKKDRVPPPPYCEVDLPTYEQATGVTAPKNDLPSVHISPGSSRNYEGPAS